MVAAVWRVRVGWKRYGRLISTLSYLLAAASSANVPSVLAYQATNTVTHTKKSVSAAIVIGMGGVGGILASTVYRQADFPRYM